MSFVYVSDILKLPRITGLKGLGGLLAEATMYGLRDANYARSVPRLDVPGCGGSGSREFQRSLGASAPELGERIRDVRLSDSASDPLMQLADMCIGAITRAERDRDKATRWKEMIHPRIGEIWHFG